MDLLTAIYWMSVNVYFEARNQPFQDMADISHVVLNRTEIRHLSVKEVIFQSNQFSWTRKDDPQKKAIEDFEVFLECMSSVEEALKQRMSGYTLFGAEYYFNPKYARPSWANAYTRVYVGNAHVFYRE